MLLNTVATDSEDAGLMGWIEHVTHVSTALDTITHMLPGVDTKQAATRIDMIFDFSCFVYGCLIRELSGAWSGLWGETYYQGRGKGVEGNCCR